MSKQKTILDAEYAISRKIALAYIVKQPIKPWLQAIPGMFIIDFLTRTKEIRKYSQYYMYFRKLAMSLVSPSINGHHMEDFPSQAQNEIMEWLAIQNINYPGVSQAYFSLVDHLVKHYERLLQTTENKYQAMIEEAYQTWDEYNRFLSELASLEQVIDQAIGAQPDKGLHQYYSRLTKHMEADEQRKKELEEIF
jgi:hypothetical protein